MPAVRSGSPIHRRGSKQFRHLPPKLAGEHRAICFAVFLISGLTLFLLQFLAFNSKNRLFQSCVFVALPVVFTLTTVLLYRSRNLNAYWQAYFSYTTTAIAITLMWLLDDLLVNWLGLDSKKPAGMAVEKVTDAVILISTVILLSKLFRVSLGSIYLQRGKLKLGLIFGILGFAVMATFGVLQARSLGISFERIREWTPWLLIFCLANGFMEELIARGLFLKKVQPFLGTFLSNLVTTIVFSIAHVGVTYSSDLLTFLVVLFVFALLAGFVMQKTDALWGSALFHAGADILIMIGIFAGVKT